MVTINNTSEMQEFSFDLSEFRIHGSEARMFRTSISENCIKLPNISTPEDLFSYESPGRSITTLIFPVGIQD